MNFENLEFMVLVDSINPFYHLLTNLPPAIEFKKDGLQIWINVNGTGAFTLGIYNPNLHRQFVYFVDQELLFKIMDNPKFFFFPCF